MTLVEHSAKEIQTQNNSQNAYPDEQTVELQLPGLHPSDSSAPSHCGVGYPIYCPIHTVSIKLLESGKNSIDQSLTDKDILIEFIKPVLPVE